MANILEIKYKIMKERIKKITYLINDKKDNNEKAKLLKILQIIDNKYEESFNKIINSKNINKSLKYKELEKIVFEELAKVEYEVLTHKV